jgi:serine/threonine protein kinase
MAMEKCKSTLLIHIEHMPVYDERTLGKIFSQMLSGIQHVHSAKIVHRDVKPENFLMGGEHGDVVKLIDFGLASGFEKDGLQGVSGTAPFMAPEMLLGMSYDETIDVWSFAIIVYVMLFGCFPYNPKVPSTANMKQAIVKGRTPTFKPFLAHDQSISMDSPSGTAVNFVKRLLIRTPEARPSATEALELPYMAAIEQNCHRTGADLPSLRPAIQSAKYVGAFESRSLRQETVDAQLNRMHFAKHGTLLREISREVHPEKRSEVSSELQDASYSKTRFIGPVESNTSTAGGSLGSETGSCVGHNLSTASTACGGSEVFISTPRKNSKDSLSSNTTLSL